MKGWPTLFRVKLNWKWDNWKLERKIRIGEYIWNNVLGNNEIDYCLNNYKGKNSI